MRTTQLEAPEQQHIHKLRRTGSMMQTVKRSEGRGTLAIDSPRRRLHPPQRGGVLRLPYAEQARISFASASHQQACRETPRLQRQRRSCCCPRACFCSCSDPLPTLASATAYSAVAVYNSATIRVVQCGVRSVPSGRARALVRVRRGCRGAGVRVCARACWLAQSVLMLHTCGLDA